MKESMPAAIARCLAATALLWPCLAFARELAPEQHIDAAESILRTVDEQARGCVEQLAEAANAEQSAACAGLLALIDGEALAGYLEHCAELKRWRDAYVENPPPAGPDSERDRQRLVGVERVCGEDALRRRSGFVATALETLGERLAARASELSLRHRIGELEFQSTLGGWRSKLDATRSNRRVRDETLRQFDQLEKELIRQQLDRPRQIQY